MKELEFPQGFVWGTATASYQIEGAAKQDGRGESIWDRYCTIPGNVVNGDNGDNACDHYNRYKDDVRLMKEMGLKAYRFSIAWPRVMPAGTGVVNEKGLEFYSLLVDELLAAGIEPYVTLYHWDLPQPMQDIGGWANDKMPSYFLEYCIAVFNRLNGRVKHWMTLNEPYCSAFLGNYEGRHAPGLKDFSTALRVAYNLYVGHGLAVEYFRKNKISGEIGIALNLMGRRPYSDSEADRQAAVYADGYLNRWFLDPIIHGTYPEDMIELYKSKGVVLPDFKADDLRIMSQPLDFVGLNYYNDFYVKANKSKWPLGFEIENPPLIPVNERGWPITEDGFTSMLLRMKNEYDIKRILITENGSAFIDNISIDGKVEDYGRLDYHKRHILAMHNAISQGVRIDGYLLWSLMDNFEWGFGYSSRFGIVYVDFATQKRTIKESGHWYSNLIAQNKLIM